MGGCKPILVFSLGQAEQHFSCEPGNTRTMLSSLKLSILSVGVGGGGLGWDVVEVGLFTKSDSCCCELCITNTMLNCQF